MDPRGPKKVISDARIWHPWLRISACCGHRRRLGVRVDAVASGAAGGVGGAEQDQGGLDIRARAAWLISRWRNEEVLRLRQPAE